MHLFAWRASDAFASDTGLAEWSTAVLLGAASDVCCSPARRTLLTGLRCPARVARGCDLQQRKKEKRQRIGSKNASAGESHEELLAAQNALFKQASLRATKEGW